MRTALWDTVNIGAYAAKPLSALVGKTCLVFFILWGIGLAFYLLYLAAKKVYLDKLCRAIAGFVETKFERLAHFY